MRANKVSWPTFSARPARSSRLRIRSAARALDEEVLLLDFRSLDQHLSRNFIGLDTSPVFDVATVQLEASNDVALGFSIGALVVPDESFRIGFGYRHEIETASRFTASTDVEADIAAVRRAMERQTLVGERRESFDVIGVSGDELEAGLAARPEAGALLGEHRGEFPVRVGAVALCQEGRLGDRRCWRECRGIALRPHDFGTDQGVPCWWRRVSN